MASYTRKAIVLTFENMLRKMPFGKITVSAIVSQCGISPNTFYYHFRDIFDLLDTWIGLISEKYVTEAMKTMTWQETLKASLRVMRENADLVYHLFDSLSRERIERWIFESSGDIFYQLVCREAEGAMVPEELLRSVAEYNSYSLLGFFLKFLWKHMDVDIDQSVDRISALFKGNIQWAIETHGKTE